MPVYLGADRPLDGKRAHPPKVRCRLPQTLLSALATTFLSHVVVWRRRSRGRTRGRASQRLCQALAGRRYVTLQLSTS